MQLPQRSQNLTHDHLTARQHHSWRRYCGSERLSILMCHVQHGNPALLMQNVRVLLYLYLYLYLDLYQCLANHHYQ